MAIPLPQTLLFEDVVYKQKDLFVLRCHGNAEQLGKMNPMINPRNVCTP